MYKCTRTWYKIEFFIRQSDFSGDLIRVQYLFWVSFWARPKRFQRNSPIQCDACQTNGYCIKVEKDTKQEDLRICQIGGQIDNYLKWKQKNPELANTNAKLYRAMNRRIVVNMIQTKYPNIDVSDELLNKFQDACEDIMFKDNLPEDIQYS